MTQLTDGILLIDKKDGETSYDVVRKIKRFSKIRKIGHAGTLDPFATGLLIILLGQGTKLSNFIMSGQKFYLATLRLGVETDTLDPTGQEVRTSPVPDISLEQVREKAREFIGEIEQTPPAFSAIKHKGVPAYRLARRGSAPELKRRKVSIFDIRILSVDLPDITMEVACSGGTYIRSLAADMAGKLGPGGHLVSLRRLASGRFSVENALCSGRILGRDKASFIRDNLIPLVSAVPDMAEVEVKKSLADKIRLGYQPSWEELSGGLNVSCGNSIHVKVVCNRNLVAIVKVNLSKGVGHEHVKIKRVFI